MWNVPTSEIQNLRNVKIKNRGSRESGEKNGSRERKARKRMGENGVRKSEAKKTDKAFVSNLSIRF